MKTTLLNVFFFRLFEVRIISVICHIRPLTFSAHRLLWVVELLTKRGVRGLVPRVYRHELESFAWVFLYAFLCVSKDNENLNVPAFRNWVYLTSVQLGKEKNYFLMCNVIRAWVQGPKQALPLSTFRIRRNLSVVRRNARYEQTGDSLPSDETLLTQVLGVSSS